MSLYFCCTRTAEPEDPNKSSVQLYAHNSTTHPDYTEKECLFVITPIFNPTSSQTRYDLYHNFAQHMKNTGAQLITIECIFPTLNQREFQVTNSNNPYHIQLRSESIYWMKENLINIAFSRLPAHAQWICWLDADIYFEDKNWIDETICALKKYTVVQVFKTTKFLGPQNQIIRTDYSFGYSVVHNKLIDQNRYAEWYPHPGYGWAMSVHAFRLIRGLPDYGIVGSGDLHFAYALLNRVTNVIERDLNHIFKNMIIENSQEIFNKLTQLTKSESKSMVGYAPLKISHYWHGSRKNRQYTDRWKILIAHNFNYFTDVWRNSDGLLVIFNTRIIRPPNYQGSSSKRYVHLTCSTLQADIQLYFERRNEDETEYKVKDNQLTSRTPSKVIQQQPKTQYEIFSPTKIKHSPKSRNYRHWADVQEYDYSHYGNNYNGEIACTSEY